MSTKILTAFSFILLMGVHRAFADYAWQDQNPLQVISNSVDCVWQGTAPFCDGECPSSYPNQAAVGRGGCDNGDYCATGQKVLCCTSSPGNNCKWYGTAPFCEGQCPSGKHQVGASDDAGDGSTCGTGCKVFCCDDASDPDDPPDGTCRNGGKTLTEHIGNCDPRNSAGILSSHNCKNKGGHYYYCVTATGAYCQRLSNIKTPLERGECFM